MAIQGIKVQKQQWIRQELLEILPYGKDWLYLDKVWVDANGQWCFRTQFDRSWHVFHHHFKHMPLVPGVIVIEMMAQLAGLYLLKVNDDRGLTRPQKQIRLVGVDKWLMRKSLRADMKIEGAIEKVVEKMGVWFFTVKVVSENQPISDGVIKLMMED